MPRRLVASSEHFHRSVAGLEPPGGVRIHVAGIDLVRDDAGTFRVLEDNLRTPSGISYVVENRRAMTHVFPELFASHRIRRVSDYPQHLLEALRNTAPAGVDEPCVVVLTPGLHNAAYFEHSFLARQMGIELVEGRDLVCRDQCVFMRTTAGEQRVDVVYRRIDDDYLDPLQFRPDSVLGCAGILNAARAGNVTIANAPGNGVADDKAVYPFVPAMIEYYLGEVPILANVETYRLDDPDVCEWVVERVDQLVCKPADGSGGYGLVIGPHASEETLVDLRVKLRANPRGWIAQQPIALSTAPTFVDGRMRPAPPRPPAVRGERRARHLGRAGRSDARRAPRGQPRRELQPGRRVEGHVGALQRAPARAGRAGSASSGGRAHCAHHRARARPAAHARRSAATAAAAMNRYGSA